ncbi:MAG: cysteine--tRNA ligase [Candidatus Kryptonium sp.]|nr:cysteine--tRNA ligase [Candidatus Kryptonium sp.]MCX7762840.1 cysteine--tRNA ligase [Candidatus Kryptonium sp.]MDW8109088.1 cysteine--tRNA ligase [Candidatus Kryptonium sp.]
MALKVYNSLTRRKEEFIPEVKGFVRMYVCGPTVYAHSHLGHAKSYVSFDVIVRYLRYLGYKVRYVQNITDVGHLTDNADQGEDKIIAQARKERLEPMELVEIYMRSYFEDMDKLGNLRPDISPRATGHIPEQIELIEILLEKGYAYEVNGSVYFDVLKFPEYGKLSGKRIEDLIAGARVEVRSEKKNPFDFALWKKAEPGHIMKWKSPWGIGYPGWHIECSAMSMKYLGETFDIHGGGIENQFPHHESEIAQSESATGKPFVRYWLHNNMVTVNGVKMSKSLGNVVTLKDAFKKYHPLVIRFFILSSHYRSPVDYSDEALEAASKGLEKLHNTVKMLRYEISKSQTGKAHEINLEEYKRRFIEAMDDDFNVPVAISVLFDLSREVNQVLNSGEIYSSESLREIDNFYRVFGGDILGLIPEEFDDKKSGSNIESQLIELLIKIRAKARADKNWELADWVRNELKNLGIILEDRKDGTTIWRYVEM